VRGYVEHYGLRIADEDIRRELAWALARGAR
jgi:predicted AAA+ superfamily ATPase